MSGIEDGYERLDEMDVIARRQEARGRAIPEHPEDEQRHARQELQHDDEEKARRVGRPARNRHGRAQFQADDDGEPRDSTQ